ERAAGDVAHPEGAHELEARQSAEIVRVPIPQCRVLRLLADDRVLHDGLAEMIDNGCDRKHAAEPLVQALLRHSSLPFCSRVRSAAVARTSGSEYEPLLLPPSRPV